MRKFTLILSLMVAMVTTAMAGDIVASENEASPEKVFTMVSGNNVSVGADAAPGDGRFAFFAVEGVENAYYIYSVTNNKWFSYAKANSYSNGTNFVTLSDTKENYFHFEKINNGYYQIRPYNNSGVAAKYLNYFGGASAGVKLGLWQDNGNSDGGSRYLIEEYVELVTVNALKDFNPKKYYTVSTSSRGGWSVGQTSEIFESTNDGDLGLNIDKNNTRNQFAVLSADGKNYYLFSIHAKKFIKADRSMVAGVADAIELTDASSQGKGRVRVHFRDVANSYINIGGSNQMTVDWWSTIDAGNAVLFVERGDFDPTEALAMLSATVTYKFSYKDEILDDYTETHNVVSGSEYPDITATFPYGISATKPEGTVIGNVEKTIELNENLPFVAADSYENIKKWYYIQMHANPDYSSYLQYAGSYIKWGDKTLGAKVNAYTWAFVGNPFEGFKLVNYAAPADANAVVSTGEGNPVFGSMDDATKWIFDDSSVRDDAKYFCFRYPGEGVVYMNAQNGKVAHWGESDEGSTMWLTERIGLGYESFDKPAFAGPGNTTQVAMIEFDGENMNGFKYEQGKVNTFEMPQVEAGKTYALNVTYEMAWGDLAVFQIDRNGAEKKYGYYTCVWNTDATPIATLESSAGALMCEELGISSLEHYTSGTYTYLPVPYSVTIGENLETGDVVVVRLMIAKDSPEYNAKDISEGGCLDLVFKVKEPEVAPVELAAGKYFRLVGSNGEYLSNEGATGSTTLKTTAEASVNTIFYIEEGLDENRYYIVSYKDGKYVSGVYRTGIGTDKIDPNEVYKQQWEIVGSNGVYTFKYGVDYNKIYYMTANATGGTSYASSENESALWTLEEVTSLPVAISAAGWATFYAPVAVKAPTGVTAYTASINKGGWVDLNEIGTTIPANTGVVLEGEQNTYNFAITTAEAYEGVNALRGTAAATYISDEAYVLGYINVAEEGQPEKKEVGFYTATMNQQDNKAWKNNSHKAYLPKPAGSGAASYSFRFGEGTTGVEEVKTENGNVKTIYDLAGRRVEAITAPGIYIVGGKKVLVK